MRAAREACSLMYGWYMAPGCEEIIARAILAERERCAMVAERFCTGSLTTRIGIADAIRKGSQ